MPVSEYQQEEDFFSVTLIKVKFSVICFADDMTGQT